MDLLELLNNGYSPILISGHGGLGYKPLRIIEGTGRHTQVQGGYSQTQVMTVPPQELKVDIVERDKKGNVKKVIKTINYKTKAEEIAELLKSGDLDNDDILNVITVSGHNMDEQFKEFDEKEKKRHEEYMKLVQKNPKLKKIYDNLNKKEEPKKESEIDFYKRRISELTSDINKSEEEHLFSNNPLSINRKANELREERDKFISRLDEIENKDEIKYKPGKRPNIEVSNKVKNDVNEYDYSQLMDILPDQYEEIVDFINDNTELISEEELPEINENYFPDSYIENTIDNKKIQDEKELATLGVQVGSKAGGRFENAMCVNDNDLPEELRIKKNLARLITGNNQQGVEFINMETHLEPLGFTGQNATCYDAFSLKARVLVELKKYVRIDDVESFHGTNNYNDLCIKRRIYVNNYWVLFKQNIKLIHRKIIEYQTDKNISKVKELKKLLLKILNSITNDDLEFDSESFLRIYRKNNNYLGIPLGINKFPIPSPSNWNEEISPNTEDDVIHIKGKRKTKYDIQMNENYKVNYVKETNKDTGDEKTEILDELFEFTEGEEYDVIFVILLRDALLYFNLSEYLRERDDEPINLFELTDSYYTDTKKGSYDSLNIPIELFTPIDLMDKNKSGVPFFYGGDKFKMAGTKKNPKKVHNLRSQYVPYVNKMEGEIQEIKNRKNKSTKKKTK